MIAAHEAGRLAVEHIRTVTDRYRGVINSYDVVNEAIDYDTTDPGSFAGNLPVDPARTVTDVGTPMARGEGSVMSLMASQLACLLERHRLAQPAVFLAPGQRGIVAASLCRRVELRGCRVCFAGARATGTVAGRATDGPTRELPRHALARQVWARPAA